MKFIVGVCVKLSVVVVVAILLGFAGGCAPREGPWKADPHVHGWKVKQGAHAWKVDSEFVYDVDAPNSRKVGTVIGTVLKHDITNERVLVTVSIDADGMDISTIQLGSE